MIEIPFTREEWEEIIASLAVRYAYLNEADKPMTINIIDRIERNLGIE